MELYFQNNLCDITYMAELILDTKDSTLDVVGFVSRI